MYIKKLKFKEAPLSGPDWEGKEQVLASVLKYFSAWIQTKTFCAL
jgi:hypothetical protein